MAPFKTSFTILAAFFSLTFLTTIKSETLFARELSAPDQFGLKTEKMTHLRFYLHDIVTAQHPTAVPVAQAATTNTSSTSFGLVLVIDDPLTVGPDLNSTLVGRAQGMFVMSSQSEVSLTMTMNLVFTEGAYKGSTLSVLAQNLVMKNPRELAIVGGTGVFRFARGYIQLRTHTINMTTLNAIVKYDAYALHY
ncbi:dirigent protein 21-like [Eucalyptus grandis]|uniref:dirigent protein 21-like n=1 Tax=Eucalyptus grandis TaxID=71139 RepID=UPI00192EBA86|nr:dirigent protein 21-like [Eucalyptus grandis]